MSHQVRMEKMIGRPARDVFQALKEGKLFMNCGGDSGSMQIDFRVGGAYQIQFKNAKKINYGEFLEIIPNKRIAFSWCQSFGPDEKPDTQVIIELFDDGPKTRLVLVHSGFKTKEIADGHERGWNFGADDLNNEIQNGRLRFTRNYKTSVEKLYEACKSPVSFFGLIGDISKGAIDFRVGGKYQVPTKKGEVKGEFFEIIPNKKIKFSWLMGRFGPLNSMVTIVLNQKDGETATLELIHEGLPTSEEQMAHRQGWEFITDKIAEAAGK